MCVYMGLDLHTYGDYTGNDGNDYSLPWKEMRGKEGRWMKWWAEIHLKLIVWIVEPCELHYLVQKNVAG